MLNLLFRPLDVDNSSCKNADCVGSDIVGAHEQKTTATRGNGAESTLKTASVCSLAYVRINVTG